MSKCSCGVVPGDCYDACGARESKISDLINERDEARAEAAALRVDAERYRWLRDDCADAPIAVWEWDGQRRIWLAKAELDAAIDQARGAA